MIAVYKKRALARRILSRNPQDWPTRGIVRGLIGLAVIGICLAIPLRTHIQAGGRLKVPPTPVGSETPSLFDILYPKWGPLADSRGPVEASSGSGGSQARPNARPDAATALTPGVEYDQLVLRQSDCSLTEAIGDFSAAADGTGNLQALDTSPNLQTTLRNASGLTPSTPANAYAKGCNNSTVGAMSTRSTIFTTELANGNYVGATLENSGINTFVSQQLNGSVTTSYVDTSNGDANAESFGLGSADLNGDGIPDLVVSNSDGSSATGNTLAILLGKSDGTFQAPIYKPLSTTVLGGFTLVDLNGDGKLDIVLEAADAAVAGVYTSHLLFLAGNGDGTFAAPITAATFSAFPAAIAAADINNDGHIDIVDSTGLVFLGDGKGGLQPVAASGVGSSAFGQYAGLALGDFNGDGKLDVALTNTRIGMVVIFLGNGDGTFTQGYSYATGENPIEISATDVDGDGNVDLVIGINSGGVFAPGTEAPGLTQFLLGKGDGTFASFRYYPSGGGSGTVSADFNGDGHTDLLAIGTAGNLQLSIGNSDGTFQPPVTAATVSNLGVQVQLLSGDLNGDGKQDVVAIAQSSGLGSLVSLIGNGNGTFQTPSALQQVPKNNAVIQAVLGDFNGDGKPDLAMIAVTSSNNGVLYLYAGNGDGTFAAPTTLDTYATNIVSNQVQAIDLNRDGKLDLVVITGPQGGTSAPTMNIYLGKGDGTFTSSAIPNVGGQNFLCPEAYFGAGDLNGDGIPDLVVAGGFAGQQVSGILLLGNGDGTFKTGTTLNIGNNYTPVGPIQIQDLNNDGKADLLYPIESDHAVAFGNGDGTFRNQTMLRVASAGSFLSAEDLDGDGLTDLLLADSGGFVPILTKGYGNSTSSSASVTTLTISPNPAALGQTVTFTATVAAGTGATGIPTGTVTFLSGTTTTLGTGTLNSGSATFSTSSLAVGTYSITASYGSDSNFAASTSSAVPLTVSASPVTIATTTTLTASSSTAAPGTNLTFAALVAPVSGSGTPSGSVAFSDGTAQLGTGTLDGTGKASYSTSSLAAGPHSITASYSGDTNYSASVSSPVSVTVTAAPPDFSINLAQTSGSVSSGSSITSTITITPINGFNQAVSLSCSGAPKNAACSVSPGTVTPSGTGPATATFTVQTGVTIDALARSNSFGRSSGSVAVGFLGGGGLLGCALLLHRRRPISTRFLAILALSVGLIAAATGCGGSNHATPTGTYTITVTASSGTDSHTVNYSLSVQ